MRCLAPSSWHGVTTVITGNCGFSLFPARPDDMPWLLQLLVKYTTELFRSLPSLIS